MTKVRTTTITVDGAVVTGEFTVEVEPIDVSTFTKTTPDLRWEHTDAAGHYHAWSKDETLPTLDTRTEYQECGMDHDDEDYDCDGYHAVVYFCSICEEVVEPAYVSRASTYREFMPGRERWSVTVPIDVHRDLRVSVRVDVADSTYFGVAVVGPQATTILPSGFLFSSTLIGDSPLGRRKNAAVPVGS